MEQLPKDDTGDVLRRLKDDGSDLSKPMEIDFFVSIPSENAGKAVASDVQKMGYRTSVEYDEETASWTCYCTKILIPSYPSVTASEKELDAVAQKYNGFIDGFGSYGN